MQLGVMTALFGGMSLDDMLSYVAEAGLDAVELPVGGYPGTPFFEPYQLLHDDAARADLLAKVRDHDLVISGLAVHGNPVHPDQTHASRDHEAFRVAVELARALAVPTVITFSGCPGGRAGDAAPNWVTCAWPPDFGEILRYQWDEVLVPYWAAEATFAHDHGVRIAWEPHPGFCVYNPDTVIRLSDRATDASGHSGDPVLGANLDPSHLFWQGIDPILAARVLGEAGLLFSVHAKDTELDPHEGPRNGYLDTRPYTDLRRRSWTFRTCGYGHGDDFWKPFVSTCRRFGYDGVLSIEHEDPLMSVEEGLMRAVGYLRDVIIELDAGEPWWC